MFLHFSVVQVKKLSYCDEKDVLLGDLLSSLFLRLLVCMNGDEEDILGDGDGLFLNVLIYLAKRYNHERWQV